MTTKTYWAGFVDGKMHRGVLGRTWCPYSQKYLERTEDGVQLFTRHKDARLYFDDVRKVEIKEVK